MNHSKKLSTLIEDLKNILNEFGDLYVAVDSLEDEVSSTAIDYEIISYDYNPTCCYPKKSYMNQHSDEWGFVSKNKKDIGSVYLHIICDSPDLFLGGDTVENFKLPKTSYEENKKIDENILKEVEDLRDFFENISRDSI